MKLLICFRSRFFRFEGVFLTLLVLGCLFSFSLVYAQGGTCTGDYVTTGSESQTKTGALGIWGTFKAYSGIDANGKRVTSVATPTTGTDAATKAYVDQAITDASGGDGVGGGGIVGGYVDYYQSWGQANCYAWGNGARVVQNGQLSKCEVLSGFVCGVTGGTSETEHESIHYIYHACVKKGSTLGGVTGGYSEFRSVGSPCSIWGEGVKKSVSAGGRDSCGPMEGYACGIIGAVPKPTIGGDFSYHAVCVKL